MLDSLPRLHHNLLIKLIKRKTAKPSSSKHALEIRFRERSMLMINDVPSWALRDAGIRRIAMLRRQEIDDEKHAGTGDQSLGKLLHCTRRILEVVEAEAYDDEVVVGEVGPGFKGWGGVWRAEVADDAGGGFGVGEDGGQPAVVGIYHLG